MNRDGVEVPISQSILTKDAINDLKEYLKVLHSKFQSKDDNENTKTKNRKRKKH
ncbi:MAG: hypothetical protein IJ574_01155 [Bacilli bacterium]|nr:hypothetical protein [Bacilli bacterium]